MMKRTVLAVVLALSLILPTAPVPPVAAADTYGNCGVQQLGPNTPIAFAFGDAHLYNYGLASPCGNQITITATYNASTKVATELIDRNVFGRPGAEGEYLCPEDPWLYQGTKLPNCKKTSQEIRGITGDDLKFPSTGPIRDSEIPLSALALSETARQTLRTLIQAAPAPKPQTKPETKPSGQAAPAPQTSSANRFPLQTVRQTAAGPNVEAIQHLLNHHGLDVVVDGDYGEQTAGAVAQFQNTRAIAEPAGVGPRTWAALMVPLKQGASFDTGAGNAVMALQTLLNKQGLDVVVDGDFGEQTAGAVRQFQTNMQLDATGEVNPTVWAALLS